MLHLLQYVGRYQSFRGDLAMIPAWGRLLLFLAALPGILLGALSLLALAVSILALLLLTVPVFRLVRALHGGREPVEPAVVTDVPPPSPHAPRRAIDVRIIE